MKIKWSKTTPRTAQTWKRQKKMKDDDLNKEDCLIIKAILFGFLLGIAVGFSGAILIGLFFS